MAMHLGEVSPFHQPEICDKSGRLFRVTMIQPLGSFDILEAWPAPFPIRPWPEDIQKYHPGRVHPSDIDIPSQTLMKPILKNQFEVCISWRCVFVPILHGALYHQFGSPWRGPGACNIIVVYDSSSKSLSPRFFAKIGIPWVTFLVVFLAELQNLTNIHPRNDLTRAKTSKLNHYFWRMVIWRNTYLNYERLLICCNFHIFTNTYSYTHHFSLVPPQKVKKESSRSQTNKQKTTALDTTTPEAEAPRKGFKRCNSRSTGFMSSWGFRSSLRRVDKKRQQVA